MLFSVLATLFLASLLTAAPTSSDKRLIKTALNVPATWMSDAEIQKLYDQNTHFMDITDTPTLEQGQARRSSGKSVAPAIPTSVTQQATVKPMIERANTDLMKAALKTLTEFNNRYYKAVTGEQSSNWLFGRVKELVDEYNKDGHLVISVKQVKHDWLQQSIIARIEGKQANDETVIIGGHQDSINHADRMEGRAPGADDDGSGTVTVLETFRVLLASGYLPKRPVEFQWYAAEEAGLLGSQAIAQAYKASNRTVVGMLQLDMTGFPKEVRDFGITTDFTDPDLTQLLRSCVTEYSALKSFDKKCGYGCSDHASWNRAGYASAFPNEASTFVNRNIHTPKDTYDSVNFDHMLEFVKLALGFLVEMSHD
jgi:leucyl aminopeptidase